MAKDLAFEQMLTHANHVGFDLGEITPTGEQLGKLLPGLHPAGTGQALAYNLD